MTVPESLTPIGLIGVGAMGSTLLTNWLAHGMDPADILVVERNAARAETLREVHGVDVVSNDEVAKSAKCIVIVVKPQDVEGLLKELAESITASQLVVSMAAGVTTEQLEHHLPARAPVVRVMPNTPALVAEGMSVMSGGKHCTPEQVDAVSGLLAPCGRVVEVPESQQDAVTAISGSGPAYIFYVVEAMIEAGVLLGLPRATSTELVVQTLFGAATMLRQTGDHPTVLRERVSSPAGTTMAALRELDDHKVRAAFLTAMEAARNRSAELSGN